MGDHSFCKKRLHEITGMSPKKAKSADVISFNISWALLVSTKCHLWLTRLSDLP